MKVTFKDFEHLMQTIAAGWNEGKARKAADFSGETQPWICQ